MSAILLVLLSGPFHPPAAATVAEDSDRVAMVIGNSRYQNLDPVPGAEKEARAVADALRDLGFAVATLFDGSRGEMSAALQRFTARLDPGTIAVFYYAGHAVRFQDRNFLLPVTADLQGDFSVLTEGVLADSVVGAMEGSGAALKLVLLDASRRNRFVEASETIEPGLSEMIADSAGTVIVHAAAPGRVAIESDAAIGAFADALTALLAEPVVEVTRLLQKLPARVEAATGGRQMPWISAAQTGELFLRAPAPRPEAPPEPTAEIPDAAPETLPETLPGTADETPVASAEPTAPAESPEPVEAPDGPPAAAAGEPPEEAPATEPSADAGTPPPGETGMAAVQPATEPAAEPQDESNSAPLERPAESLSGGPAEAPDELADDLAEDGRAGTPTDESADESAEDGKAGSSSSGKRTMLQAIEDALSSEDKHRIQAALANRGHYDGEIDGIFGPGTREAIRAFQQATGAPVTGWLSAAQIHRLLRPEPRPRAAEVEPGKPNINENETTLPDPYSPLDSKRRHLR